MGSEVFTIAAIVVAGVAAVAAAAHAILWKRDVRASIGWAGFILVAPYAGALIYFLFGINRIRRRAAAVRADARRMRVAKPASRMRLAELHPDLANQVLLGDRVCRNELLAGNLIQPFDGGERAFAAIGKRVAAARASIEVATYIFEQDETGRRVIDALAAAARRGVAVRVLIDGVGSRKAGDIIQALVSRGVRAATFLPPRNPLGMLSINLRNHRKLVVIDDTIAFTGGMNISSDYGGPAAFADVQFQVEGPVVAELHETFAADWFFTTGERIGPVPPPSPAGTMAARVVADGPDEHFEHSRWLILGAISMARQCIRIASPYFLPDQTLITALNTAALRGVGVQILIPEKLDHAPVKWASNAQLWQVLEKGCRVWFTKPPFDHSKLFTVDGIWTFFGSSNWDARSLRLNFELNVEAVSEALTRSVDALIERRIGDAREVTLEEMDARAWPIRLRDSVSRLFSPYL